MTPLASAIEAILRAVPPGVKIEMPREALEALARAWGGRPVSLTLGEARAAFLTPRELYDAGGGEVSVAEAAKLAGVSRQAMLALVKRGRVKARRIGKVFVVDVASLRAYVEKRR